MTLPPGTVYTVAPGPILGELTIVMTSAIAIAITITNTIVFNITITSTICLRFGEQSFNHLDAQK